MVTMWGGGGGGGAGNVAGAGCTYGSGGGGGAYTQTVVPVTAGLTYAVTVGSGGIGGVNAGDNGSNGGDSQFALGNTLLAFAGAGQGGSGGTTSGSSSTAGIGGQADSTAQISHAGHNGYTVSNPHSNGLAYAANLQPNGSVSSTGISSGEFNGYSFGLGGLYGNCGSAVNGTSGYVLLTF